MATTTPRLGLRKPATTDLVTVGTDLDANFDILDGVLQNGITNAFQGPSVAGYFVALKNNANAYTPLRLESVAAGYGLSGDYQLTIRHLGYASGDALIGMDSSGTLSWAYNFGGGPNLRMTLSSTGDLTLPTNPGVGNQSALLLSFSSVGTRRLDVGAVDSAGVGFRTVRAPN